MPVPTPPFTIDWGDGTVSTDQAFTALSHEYAQVSSSQDEYKVVVTDAAGRRGTTMVYVVKTPVITGTLPHSLDSSTTAMYASVTLYGRNFSPNIEFSLNDSGVWQTPALVRENDGTFRTTELRFNVPVETFRSLPQITVVLRVRDQSRNPMYAYSVKRTIPVDAPDPHPFDSSFDYAFQPSDPVGPSVPATRVPDESPETLKTWVGGDVFRASAALDAELHRPHPRQALITYFDALIKGTP